MSHLLPYWSTQQFFVNLYTKEVFSDASFSRRICKSRHKLRRFSRERARKGKIQKCFCGANIILTVSRIARKGFAEEVLHISFSPSLTALHYKTHLHITNSCENVIKDEVHYTSFRLEIVSGNDRTTTCAGKIEKCRFCVKHTKELRE